MADLHGTTANSVPSGGHDGGRHGHRNQAKMRGKSGKPSGAAGAKGGVFVGGAGGHDASSPDIRGKRSSRKTRRGRK